VSLNPIAESQRNVGTPNCTGMVIRGSVDSRHGLLKSAIRLRLQVLRKIIDVGG